jgi:hypothetical protein
VVEGIQRKELHVRVLTIAVVLLLALAGGGCGGGDDETAGDTDTVLTDTTDTTTTDDTDGTTTDDGDDGDVDGIDTADCAELIAASSSLSQAFSAIGGVDSDADEAQELFEDWADNAPEEIRDDLQVLAGAYATYVTALDDVDFEAGQVPDAETLAEFQAALASLDQEAVTEASQNLSEWSTENC